MENLNSVLFKAKKYLINNSIKSANIDSEILMCSVLKKSRDHLILNILDKIDYEKLAEMTDGMSVADVASIANTAVSLVVHEHLDDAASDENMTDDQKKVLAKEIEDKAKDATVTMKHFEEAVRKVREQKDLKMNEKLVASYYR